MATKTKNLVLADGRIENRIYYVRGKKVMFDRDLAVLYGVDTKRLNEAVRRNRSRFPQDFMFQLNIREIKVWSPLLISQNSRSQIATLKSNKVLRSQIATLKQGQHLKYRPYVFTEQGVAMLSSVLRSERAVQVNIAIMRTFVKIRELVASNKGLLNKFERLERKYDMRFRVVFDAIRKLLAAPKEEPKNNVISFR